MCIRDRDKSDYLLSFGADFLSTWASPTRYSRGYGEFRQGHDHRGKLVHIDSRFSATAANADEWIRVNPGTEGLFALAVIQSIVSKGHISDSVVNALTGGDSGWLSTYSPENVSEEIGVTPETILHVGEDFSHSNHALAIGGGSAAAHSNGYASVSYTHLTLRTICRV